MEHRYSQRTRSDNKLFIYERGTPVAIGRCRNLSRYGLFIETDHSVYANQPIEIEIIRGRDRKKLKSERIKCYVVHLHSNGFGVEIDEENINLFGAIASSRSETDRSQSENVVENTRVAAQFAS